jgi:hypothetical protein
MFPGKAARFHDAGLVKKVRRNIYYTRYYFKHFLHRNESEFTTKEYIPVFITSAGSSHM